MGADLIKIIYKKKSQKTLLRMAVIREELAAYVDSIQLLHDYANGNKTLRGGDYVDRAAYIRRTLEDEERYHWTLKNIRTQILLLERELCTLQKYGE